MQRFTQGDLQYNYRWTARPQDNPNFRKGSDYRNFNRNEGYEMLFVINEYMENHNLISIASGRKIESLIKEKLPSRVYSHTELYDWITRNW